MNLLTKLRSKAKKTQKTIVFPEADDERMLKAADFILKQKIAKIILLGNVKKTAEKAGRLGLALKGIEIIDPSKSEKSANYAKKLYYLRKGKGMDLKKATALVKKPIYFGMMLLEAGKADALIAGAVYPTKEVLIPAFHIIKNKTKASGAFLMLINNKPYLFADCAVQADPNPMDLADIALNSAKTFENLTNQRAKVGVLSFSTKGSAKHQMTDKVKKAVKIARRKNKRLIIDGELQLDAAIIPWIAKKKNPKGAIKGDANILIFPNLDAGNIGYKLVERFCNAKAIGPIIQGLKKPVNDLSRGCSVEDIINLSAVSAVQAK